MLKLCGPLVIIGRSSRAKCRRESTSAAAARACHTCANFFRRNCKCRSNSLTPCAMSPSPTRRMRERLHGRLIFSGKSLVSLCAQLLEDLNARLPKDNIWITELVPLSNGKPVLGATAGPAGATATTPEPAATPSTLARSVTGRGGPAIDGLLIRGLYLWNARQQEVVIDYFKNLVGSPFFKIDPTNQQRVIKPTMPNNNEWAFPYELQLDLKQPLPLP